MGQLKLKYFNWDFPEPSAYAWQDYWSRFSRRRLRRRVGGTVDCARLFELTVTRFVNWCEFRTIPIRRGSRTITRA